MHLDPKDQLKSRIDLWIHSNNLMWSRLQPLYFIQAAYFAAIGYALKSSDLYVMNIALTMALVADAYLISIVYMDRQFRDTHGRYVYKKYRFDVYEYSNEQRIGYLRNILKTIGLFFIYLGWGAIDVVAYIYVAEPKFL